MAGITQNKQKALFSLWSLNKNNRNVEEWVEEENSNNNNIDDSNKTNNNNNIIMIIAITVVIIIITLHNNRRSSGVKYRFFLYKNFNVWFIFLMVFNAIDSPDIVSSSKQPRYVTLEYWFISIPLYIILRFPASFNLSFEPKSMHFVFSLPRWILNLLSTNHSHKLAKSLFNWCLIVWISLCWNVILESSAY